MTSINTNFNNNYGFDQRKIGFKAQPQAIVQDVQLPDMYYMPDYANKPKSFKETIKKYDLMGLIYNWFEHPFLMLGTCLGISYGVGKAEKSFAREYAESSLGKAAALGDKLEQSAFVQNKTTQNILGGIKKGWKGTIDLLKKNSVIRAMIETPTQPENSMPKGEMKHTEANIVDKFKNLIQEYGLQETKEAEHTGLMTNIKKPFKQLFKIEEKEYTEILKGLGRSDAEIDAIVKGSNPKAAVSDELRKALNFSGDDIKNILKDENGETAELVEKYCEKIKKVPKFGEIYNRLHCIGKGAETKTGRFFAKMLQKLYKGFTFGNSKYGVMFWVAPFLVNTLVNTHKADKKEKVGTFIDGLIQSVSWVFVFPLVLKGIHAIGGAKNAGMSVEKVKRRDELIDKFNERVLKKEFKTKDDYNKAYKSLQKRIKALERVKNQSLLTKIVRKLSAFTKADLKSILPFNNGKAAGNFMRMAGHNMKSFAYSVGRFGVFFLIGMPFVDKIIEKCTSTIFGKPYDAMKEEENAENKKAQEEYALNDLRERMMEVQRRKLVGATQSANDIGLNNIAIPKPNQLEQGKESAMTEVAAAVAAEQAAQKQQTIQPQQVQQIEQPVSQQINQPQQQAIQAQTAAKETVQRDNYTYIPSQENVLNTINPQAQINKYIPSQIGAKFDKTFDNSGLDAALRRANNAEKRALGVLSGNFNTRY